MLNLFSFSFGMKGLLTYLHTLSIKGFTQLIQKFDICSTGFAQLVQNSNNHLSHKGLLVL